MDLGLKGRVAAVTGGSKGIGEATARGLAREGAKVAICARGIEGLRNVEDTIKSEGGEVMTLQADLGADKEAANRFIEAVVQRYGKLDIVIAAAGHHEIKPFIDITDDDWERVYNNNFFSTARTCRASIPHLQKNKWGRIVIVSAGSIHKQSLDWDVHPHYTTAKAAAANLAKFLSKQYAEDNILVNSVLPAYSMKKEAMARYEKMAQDSGITTNEAFLNEARAINFVPALARPGTPEEFADVIVFLASERSSYLTGVQIPIDGGGLDWG